MKSGGAQETQRPRRLFLALVMLGIFGGAIVLASETYWVWGYREALSHARFKVSDLGLRPDKPWSSEAYLSVRRTRRVFDFLGGPPYLYVLSDADGDFARAAPGADGEFRHWRGDIPEDSRQILTTQFAR